MNTAKNSSERRRHKRMVIQDRALITLDSDKNSLPYHIRDIGGLAFRYLGQNERNSTLAELNIFLDESLCLGNVPIKKVADRPVDNSYLPVRICGVSFRDLTEAQESNLNDLLKTHALIDV